MIDTTFTVDIRALESIKVPVQNYHVSILPALISPMLNELSCQIDNQGFVLVPRFQLDLVIGILNSLIATSEEEIDLIMLCGARETIRSLLGSGIDEEEELP